MAARALKNEPPRQQRILDAAAHLFYERGYAAVGVDEIGERAGVTGPAIYRHFSGKDEILATLFDQALDGLISVTSGEFANPKEHLEHMIRRHAAFVVREWRLAAILIQEGRSLAEPYRGRLERRERRYIDGITEILRRCFPGRSDAELSVATWTAVSALNSVAVWPRKVLAIRGVEDHLAAIVRGGLDGLGSAETATM
jgi:AcrR family transcriptional regulator